MPKVICSNPVILHSAVFWLPIYILEHAFILCLLYTVLCEVLGVESPLGVVSILKGLALGLVGSKYTMNGMLCGKCWIHVIGED